MNFLAFLSKILAEILKFFNSGLELNMGWSIILLTLVLKIILFPTSISQIKSMEGMKKIQPLLKEIQNKYKDRPEEFQKRSMELYKTHGVNPFGGCLPLLLQLPFLWALFSLLQKPEVYGISLQETFFGISLVAKNVIALGILSAVTTFWQQKISSPSNDPSQSAMLYMMPLFFGYITWTFPAGIGIYWVVSNIIGVLQQIIITRYFIPKKNEANLEPRPEKGTK